MKPSCCTVITVYTRAVWWTGTYSSHYANKSIHETSDQYSRNGVVTLQFSSRSRYVELNGIVQVVVTVITYTAGRSALPGLLPESKDFVAESRGAVSNNGRTSSLETAEKPLPVIKHSQVNGKVNFLLFWETVTAGGSWVVMCSGLCPLWTLLN